MTKPPTPPDEEARLARLAAYGILDTKAEQAYDDITRLAAFVCGAPIALVSLIDRDRQWFKARVGLDAEQTPRDISFCGHAILGPDVFVVPDALRDTRFADNPLVTAAPGIRFYAGAPLRAGEGSALGTLCVIDRQPRVLTDEQQSLLAALANQVMLLLERRRHVSTLEALVAERETSARTAQESELQFRQILDALPVGVFAVDATGRPTVANRMSRTLLGQGADPSIAAEALPEAYRAYVPGTNEILPRERSPVLRALTGKAVPAETVEIRRSAGPILIEASGTPVFDRDGGVMGSVTVFSDITEARRAQRRANVQHETAAILTTSGRVRDVLDRLLRRAGEVIGCDVVAIWMPEPAGDRLTSLAFWTVETPSIQLLAQARYANRLREDDPLSGVAWRDGMPRWVSAHEEGLRVADCAVTGLRAMFAVPITVDEQRVAVMEFMSTLALLPDVELLEVLGDVGRQITHYLRRREAERALRLSEARVTSILKNMHGALVTLDSSGRVESFNPSAERIFGVPDAGAMGRLLTTLVDLGEAGDLTSVLLERAGRVTQAMGRRASGGTFPLELTVFQFEAHGGPRWAVNALDITARQEAARLKQEFVSSVSHELRTPLTSIRGSLGLLSGGACGELPGQAREVVALAERNVTRLVTLINDILDIERLDSGRMEMDIAPREVAGVLQKAVEAVATFADSHRVHIDITETTAICPMDEHRIVQVLVNLLSNAVKFSPAGSTVHVAATADDTWLEVRVADSGRGVPAHLQSAIFERFRQVEASDARREGGTGLGLSICRAIVEQHGGTIGVESVEGSGSTFWFRLPLQPPPASGHTV